MSKALRARGSVITAAILAVLLIWVVIHHVVFFLYDGRSLPDHDVYFTNPFGSLLERRLAVPADSSFIAWLPELIRSNPYPLGNAWLAALAGFVRIDLFRYRLALLPFYGLLIAGCYLLGKGAGRRGCGLLCAFLAATLPVFDNFSRKWFPHFQVTAFLVCAHAMVLRVWEHRWTPRRALGLGALVGLSYRAHPITALLAAPVALFAAASGISRLRARRFKRRSFLHPAIALAVMGALSLSSWKLMLWYVPLKWKYLSGDMDTRRTDLLLADWERWKAVTLHLQLGAWFSAAAGLGIALVAAACIVPKKRQFPVSYLASVTAYYMALNLWVTAHGGSPHDLMILFAVFPPLVGAASLALWESRGRPRWMRAAGGVLVAACITTGLAAKADSWKTSDPVEQEMDPSTTHLRVFPERDLPARVLAAVRRDGASDAAQIVVHQAWPADASAARDNEVMAFQWMRLLAVLNGLTLCPSGAAAKEVPRFRLVFLPLPGPLIEREAAALVRRMADEYAPADARWFYAPRPYCEPFCPLEPAALAMLVRADAGGADPCAD